MLSGQNSQQSSPGLLQPLNGSQGTNFGLLDNLNSQGRIMQGSPQPTVGSGSDGDIGSLLGALGSLAKNTQEQLGMGSTQQGSPGLAVTQQALSNPNKPASTQGTLGAVVQNSGIFNNAMQEMGLKSNDPTLQHYLAKANPNLDPNTTPWCAGFVGSVLNSSGLKGTGSLSAKSYLNYGQPTSSPTTGDIAVFNDLTGHNDPSHGHVGFVQRIDQNSGKVIVLGGNQDGSVSLKAYPLSMVAGFRVPPSGQEVKQYAQQQGISSPQQLSNITKEQSNRDMNPQTINLIKQFEGYTPKAQWDVNAYRAGYGSDTITLADGTVQHVQQGTQVNQADADRDLARRTQEFENTAIDQVGQKTWTSLTPNAQSALTSIAYNYGSLPKRILPAVETGDPSKIATAIKGLAGDNNGVNSSRRNAEANFILQGNGPTSQQTINNKDPITKEFNPTQPTDAEHVEFEKIVKEIDGGHDSYSMKGPHFDQNARHWVIPGQPPGRPGGMPLGDPTSRDINMPFVDPDKINWTNDPNITVST